MAQHGTPVWFELATPDTARAQDFYGKVFGWQTSESGMEGFAYTLAHVGAEPVAGIYDLAACPPDTPPHWLVYVAAADVDAAAAQAAALGGTIRTDPADIPGTGRFAILADPQGAAFGILQPEPPANALGGAWNQRAAGHGAWIELMSTAPDAALDFYAALFGWAADGTIDMGKDGDYRFVAQDGARIGGLMGLGPAPFSCWMPYFSTDDVGKAIATTETEGGRWIAGPSEVPGPALIAVLADPTGAVFAIVGPKP